MLNCDKETNISLNGEQMTLNHESWTTDTVLMWYKPFVVVLRWMGVPWSNWAAYLMVPSPNLALIYMTDNGLIHSVCSSAQCPDRGWPRTGACDWARRQNECWQRKTQRCGNSIGKFFSFNCFMFYVLISSVLIVWLALEKDHVSADRVVCGLAAVCLLTLSSFNLMM